MSVSADLKTLYSPDFNLWLETAARLLGERKLEQIDYDNLSEEIASIGRSEKNALRIEPRLSKQSKSVAIALKAEEKGPEKGKQQSLASQSG